MAQTPEEIRLFLIRPLLMLMNARLTQLEMDHMALIVLLERKGLLDGIGEVRKLSDELSAGAAVDLATEASAVRDAMEKGEKALDQLRRLLEALEDDDTPPIAGGDPTR